MSDAPDGLDRAQALAVEAAPRGARVVLSGGPPGQTQAERATTARGAVRAQAADVALWIEADADGARSIRAVAADRETTTWAPLSASAGDPTVVALIAVSVIDDLLAPPVSSRPEVQVDVRMTVAAPAVGEALATPSPRAPSAPAGETAAHPQEPQRRDFYLEVGPMIAGVSNGAYLGAGLYVHRNVRLDVNARLTYVIPSESLAGAATGSAAYVTDDDDGRFEVGLSLGLFAVSRTTNRPLGAPCRDVCVDLGTDVGFLGGAYAGFSWGFGDDVRLGFRAHIDVAYLDDTFTPAPMLDLYLQVMP